VKQTYSVYLNEDEGNKRKWHLSTSLLFSFPRPYLIFLAAYFTQATVDTLGTVDDIPVLKDLVVPEGLFKSSRRTKARSSRANAAAHATDTLTLSAPASSSNKSGNQIACVAGPSSVVSRPALQVTVQSAVPQQNQSVPPSAYPQNQGVPPSAYPQDLFNAQPPASAGLPPSLPPPPTQHHDAYTRMYTEDPYASPHPSDGYHLSPSPHMQTHVASFGYNWQAPPASVPDHACQSPYPYPVLVPQNGDSSFHHSPTQSQLYVYGSGYQTSPQLLSHHRPVSPALSLAPSQFSVSSQSQSSSESESPGPGPVSLRPSFFPPDRLSVVLPTDGEPKYETIPLHKIREHDGAIDPEMGLAPLETLKRYHPYKRDPRDDRTLQSLTRLV
jgi:hypothetical protein